MRSFRDTTQEREPRLRAVSRRERRFTRKPRPDTFGRAVKTVGLFAGIGGIELGLKQAGHEAVLLCEIDRSARAVLEAGFPGVPLAADVMKMRSLPAETEVLAAGFPCQDMSQAGRTAGIGGKNSGLVREVFRLLGRTRVPWVVLENVPFMLQLARGRAMDVIASAFEDAGYDWAYRVVDTRSFGVPQRRKRVYFVASRVGDPREVLYADESGEFREPPHRGRACGFYWTEGLRGLGWAVDAVPTLKGGSTVGIPSPPAIWMTDGRIVTPDLRDAERLQGFDVDWTAPAAEVVRASFRWKLVGNAVSVPVAAWIGRRLASPGKPVTGDGEPCRRDAAWPGAVAHVGGAGRRAHAISPYPFAPRRGALRSFLRYEPKMLSERATRGFVSRLLRSGLEYPAEFLTALEHHLRVTGASGPSTRRRRAGV